MEGIVGGRHVRGGLGRDVARASRLRRGHEGVSRVSGSRFLGRWELFFVQELRVLTCLVVEQMQVDVGLILGQVWNVAHVLDLTLPREVAR